jgi:phage tail-like protein
VSDRSEFTRFEFTLSIIDPQGDESRYPLEETTTLGRQPGNDIELTDQRVSRRHARIDCGSDGCTLTDLDSSNGTYIGPEKLPPQTPSPLKPGAEVSIGPFSLRLIARPIREEEPVAAEAPQAMPPEEPVGEAEPSAEEPATSGEAAEPPPTAPSSPAAPTPPEEGAPDIPPGLSVRSRRLLSYLPGIYHTDFMARFLGLFEAISTPIEWEITHFDMFLSPGTAPEDFLPWLANWFDLTFDDSWTEAQRRTLLSKAHRIYARRGTRWALSRVLEIYTGHEPEVIDTGKDLEPFTFRVILPDADRARQSLIERLINAHKPAHTTYTLEFSG